MRQMGMVSNGNHYFTPNRFLCSNLNILTVIFIIMQISDI